ncbi:MAG: hypothetical protein SFU25_04950 [Candidatus Caenarcaniphilales bacterium]|nr:hypothetical protein [Candidatus Caenarcaniphilales bacterium]
MVIHLDQLLQDQEYFNEEEYFQEQNLDQEVSAEELAVFLETLKQVAALRSVPYRRRDVKTIIKAFMSAGIAIEM